MGDCVSRAALRDGAALADVSAAFSPLFFPGAFFCVLAEAIALGPALDEGMATDPPLFSSLPVIAGPPSVFSSVNVARSFAQNSTGRER